MKRKRKRRLSRGLATVAVHEAGHAIAALVTQRGWTEVAIESGKDCDGHCTTIDIRRDAPMGLALAEIVCCLGGLVAEQIASEENEIPEGAEDDIADALRWIARVPGASLPDTLKLTRHLLRGSWPAVECVAAVLLDERRLRVSDVRRLVEAR